MSLSLTLLPSPSPSPSPSPNPDPNPNQAAAHRLESKQQELKTAEADLNITKGKVAKNTADLQAANPKPKPKPKPKQVEAKLVEMAHAMAEVPMLAHTHGQPATPTTVGKEFANVVHRLRGQMQAVRAAQRSLGMALQLGYRAIDTAFICGPEPMMLGIASALSEFSSSLPSPS